MCFSNLFFKQIRSFPSKEFYAESLEDGPNIEVHTSRSWHGYQCFGPFCFFDLHEGRESKLAGSESWVNVDEVEFVLLMYHKLVSMYPGLKSSSQLAIISPYSQQVKLLRDRFKSTFGVDSNKVVDITTVDGCQVNGSIFLLIRLHAFKISSCEIHQFFFFFRETLLKTP
jgi:senataxin